MGASDFSTTMFGKDADDAFHKAVEEARYYHGHGGYTGTIAEKDSFYRVDLGKMRLQAFFKALDACRAAAYADEEAMRDWGTKREQAKRRTAAKRARAKFERAAGTRADEVGRAFRLSDDKWGPAVCVEVTGKEAREYRERRGLKGKKGCVFCFFGTASS